MSIIASGATLRNVLHFEFFAVASYFSEGFAEAAIQDIRINDEGTYRCDLDINRKQAQTSFDIRVYSKSKADCLQSQRM